MFKRRHFIGLTIVLASSFAICGATGCDDKKSSASDDDGGKKKKKKKKKKKIEGELMKPAKSHEGFDVEIPKGFKYKTDKYASGTAHWYKYDKSNSELKKLWESLLEQQEIKFKVKGPGEEGDLVYTLDKGGKSIEMTLYQVKGDKEFSLFYMADAD